MRPPTAITIAHTPCSLLCVARTTNPSTDWFTEFSNRPTRLVSNTWWAQKS